MIVLFSFFICCTFSVKLARWVNTSHVTIQEGDVLTAELYDTSNGTRLMSNEDIYIYSPRYWSQSKAFCDEGVKVAAVDGIRKCTVSFGWIEGDGKLYCSDQDQESESEVKFPFTIAEGNVKEFHIGPQLYAWSWDTSGRTWVQIIVTFLLCVVALAIASCFLCYVMCKGQGNKEMQKVHIAIRDGSYGFLCTQYCCVAITGFLLALLIFGLYCLRPASDAGPKINKYLYAFIVAFTFLFGLFFSASSGIVSMIISVLCNSRVADAATRSYGESFRVALFGGGFISLLINTMAVLGVGILFTVIYMLPKTTVNALQTPDMMTGFAFGAAFSGLFAQLGGGIFTKSADMAADLIGKNAKGLKEDDFRNPAVIADLVGDNVGDCAGRGADLFETITNNMIAVIILGVSMAYKAYPEIPANRVYDFAMYPTLALAFGLIASFLGVMVMSVFTLLADKDLGIDIYADERLEKREEMHGGEGKSLLKGDEEEGEREVEIEVDRKVEDEDELEEGGEKVEDGDEEEAEAEEPEDDKGDGVIPDTGVGINREGFEDIEKVNQSFVEKWKERWEDLQTKIKNFTVKGCFEWMLTMITEPNVLMLIGFVATFFTSSFFIICVNIWCFIGQSDQTKYAWLIFSVCGIIGIFISCSVSAITFLYTDYALWPTIAIAKSAQHGPANVIVSGVGYGMQSTLMASVVIGGGMLISFWLGKATGYYDENSSNIGGIFGICAATLGMIMTSPFILALDTFGPIADNAGGIVEMSGLPEEVRVITDKLDAVGNTVKALTKGYAMATACLAASIVVFAFLDIVSNYCQSNFYDVNIASPELFVAGLCGAVTVFIFVAVALGSVSTVSRVVMKDILEQFEKNPEILVEGSGVLPNYKQSVQRCTRHALIHMMLPGLIGVFSPIITGFVFRLIGYIEGDDLLGVSAGIVFLIFNTITNVLMGIYLTNTGGAWDNAKKYVETGKLGGKGTDTHKAVVIGDTVGDPFKDTAGPSLNILVTLVATVTLVIGPLWINPGAIQNSD